MNPPACCPACGTPLRAVDGLCPACVARSISTLFTARSAAAPEEEPEIPGYDLEEVIGRGGMGIVFRAVRLSDDLPAAVKLMPANLADHADLAERFAREVQALTALDHPHILRVLDSGVAGDGRWFLVTELAGGGDLARRLKQGPLPVAEALRLFRETAAAIGEAHRRGIAHRDIKPANILLAEDGGVRVGDFSLAKLLREHGAEDPALTRSAEVFGTPYYIAPEVRRGAAGADERADFFSLGVLLHEMLTGRLPLGEYEPASRLAPVPRGVDALIAQCLQEDPSRRPPSAEVLLERLEAAVQPAPHRWKIAAWLVAALAVAIFSLFKQKWTEKPIADPDWPEVPAPPGGAATATKERPWENSLGMRFVPVEDTGVLFCVWETRRRDFERFAQQDRGPALGPRVRWRQVRDAQPDDPVQPVTMNMAAGFCDWLTLLERHEGRITAQQHYRLPEDDEWSRAVPLTGESGTTPEQRHLCLGGDGHGVYVWGRGWPPQGRVGANFADADCDLPVTRLMQHDGYRGPAPVDTFEANRFGIHHLSGNASEWCATRWNAQSDDRVLRGGAWIHGTRDALRLDARQPAQPGDAPDGAGFRVVLDLGAR